MFGSGFRRKARQYSYKPLYFDPEKEERDARRKLSSSEKDEKPYVPGMFIRSVRSQRILGIEPKDKVIDKEKTRMIIIRLVIFFVILVLLGYGLMSSNFIEMFLSMTR